MCASRGGLEEGGRPCNARQPGCREKFASASACVQGATVCGNNTAVVRHALFLLCLGLICHR